MKNQHTPGPWTVLRHVGVYAGKDLIASIHSPMPEPTNSNARLIAAAPDMFVTLEKIAAISEFDTSSMGWVVDLAKSVINQINSGKVQP